ncbi:hypothetical protein [Streptomyces sp. NPDC058603]|uniref:hypothetical protein n=1 Tax=unclassified Streptomyces TaxID=2593676 RepID=UPI00364656CC
MQTHVMNLAASYSALDALLIVVAVVVGLVYCVIFIISPSHGLAIGFLAVSCFTVGYFGAVTLGGSRTVGYVSGGSVFVVAYLVCAHFYFKEVDRIRENRQLEWEYRVKEAKKGSAGLDRYWNTYD